MISTCMAQVSRYLLVGLFVLIPSFVIAAEEYIESFEAQIELSQDGSFSVVETITYVFPDERHGVIRDIPIRVSEPSSIWFKERYIDVTLNDVLMDGERVRYETGGDGKALELKIGNPDETISGSHTYTIAYTVVGGILFPQFGGAELYWNVTGNGWEVPMRSVTARVSSLDPILTRERACYRGRERALGSCDRIEEIDGQITFRASNLGPGEGLTIAQAVDRSKIARNELERFKPVALWIFSLVAWFLGLGVAVYRYKTAYDTDRPLIPQYEPYPGTKPMYSGLLIDGRLDPHDISACIVYLAEQGYLKIRRTESKVLFFFEVDDYEIELLKEFNESEGEFEKSILSLLFEHGAVPGTKVTLDILKQDLMRQKKNYFILKKLKSDLEQDLEKSGFFQSFPSVLIPKLGTHSVVKIVGVIVSIALIYSLLPQTGLMREILLFGSLLILSFGYRRRTTKGHEALDHLKGFREFLSVTDTERFEFHNAPKKNPEQFMKYLPYAIAFGVEEKWAKVFSGIAIPNPTWYNGASYPAIFSRRTQHKP
jgi:hypothetical protein